ncbi:MAG: DMT family transporter [Pseudomonadota bacterium]
MSTGAGYALIMVAAGIGIPVMAAMNSRLGQILGNPALAVAVLLCVAAVLVVATVSATQASSSDPSSLSVARFTGAPPLLYGAGVFVAFYLLSITWLAPRIGVGNAVFFVLLGQLLSTAAIDHFGWLGALQFKLTPQRLVGLALMAAGIYLARRPG